MDESKRRAIQFLEKEIRTYAALALFLSKKDIEKHLRAGGKGAFFNPAFYNDGMKEAKELVGQLKNPN